MLWSGWSGDTTNAVLLVVGVAWCFAGYRFFKPTLFCGGAIAGGSAGALCFGYLLKLDGSLDARTGGFVAEVVFGLLGGRLALSIFDFGVFCCGAVLGVCAGAALNNSVVVPLAPAGESGACSVGVLVVLGLAGGLLAVGPLERHLLIWGTAFCGAYFVVQAAGHFGVGGDDFPSTFPSVVGGSGAARSGGGGGGGGTMAGWWEYFGGLLALFLAGLYTQLRHTARGHDFSHHRPEQRRLRAQQKKQTGARSGPADDRGYQLMN